MSTLTAPAPTTWALPLDSKAGRPTELGPVARHAAPIVLIVAIAVVLIAGIVAFSLVAAQCIKHNYHHVSSYGPNGWKVWQFRIVCTK